jgi:hypothetical protein
MIDDFGLKVNIEPKEMTLADVWNGAVTGRFQNRNKIGFAANENTSKRIVQT